MEALHYRESIYQQDKVKSLLNFAEKNNDNFEVFVKMAVEWVIHFEKLHELQKHNLNDGLMAMVLGDNQDAAIVHSDSDIDICDSDCDTCCVSVDESPSKSSGLLNLSVDSDDEHSSKYEHEKKSSMINSLKSRDSSMDVIEDEKSIASKVTSSLLSPNAKSVNDTITPLPMSLQTIPRDSTAINCASSVIISRPTCPMVALAKSSGHVADDSLCRTTTASVNDCFKISTAASTENENVSVAIPGYFKSMVPTRAGESNESAPKLTTRPKVSASSSQFTPAMDLPNLSSSFKIQGRSSTTSHRSRHRPYKMPVKPRGDKRNKIFKIYKEHKDLDDLLHCQTTKLFYKRNVKPFVSPNSHRLKFIDGHSVFLNYKFERTSESEAYRILGRLEEIDDEMEDIPFTADDVLHFAEKSKLAEELDRAMNELPESII